MAKVKSDEKNKNADKAVDVVKGDKKPKAKKAQATPKKAKAAPKKAKSIPIREQVTHALTAKRSRSGVTLIAIRKYMVEMFDTNVTKVIQNNVKKFIEEEFAEGRIVMVNDESDKINFTKRFNFTSEAAKAAKDARDNA